MLATGCGSPSAAEAKAEFDEYVAARNACAKDDECVLAAAGCPLGCYAAVHRDHQAAVEAKARDLIEDYESGGQACSYGCMAATAVCRAGRCAAEQQ